MATNQVSFTTTHIEALRAFGKTNSGSAFGKWVVCQLGGLGFWSGADYDFFFAYRDIIRGARQQGKRLRPDAQITFAVNRDGRGVVTLG